MFALFTSDAELDNQYAAARRAGDMALATEIGAEIIQRMTSVFGFLGATISGASDFPQYEKLTGFDAGGAARDSVSAAASNVADSAASGAAAVFDFVKKPVIIALGVGLLALFVYGKARGK